MEKNNFVRLKEFVSPNLYETKSDEMLFELEIEAKEIVKNMRVH